MVLEGRGRVVQPERSRTLVYLPARLVQDSQFPFEPGQEVVVRIERGRLVVEPMSKGKGSPKKASTSPG